MTDYATSKTDPVTPPVFDDLGITLYHADCLDALPLLADSSVDSVVTDPPYGLEFMGKGWDGADGFRRSLNPNDVDRASAFGRTSRTSPEYRAGSLFQEWCEAWASECLRVLKPGGYLLAFGGTRTWHRLAVAVEDAGFEIRDSIAWMYGSGFPKSHASLKPAHEPVVVARKKTTTPRTGLLNIDACRIDGVVGHRSSGGFNSGGNSTVYETEAVRRVENTDYADGRWPANVVLDESQATELDRQSGAQNPRASGWSKSGSKAGPNDSMSGGNYARNPKPDSFTDPGGGAARFFYVAKADQSERVRLEGVAHPTVKPIALMRWLVRLVTPPGGTVLEPFAGSGTTVEACLLEGFQCIAVEREADYLPLIVQRLNRRADPVAAVRAAGDDVGLFDLLPERPTVTDTRSGEASADRRYTAEGGTNFSMTPGRRYKRGA